MQLVERVLAVEDSEFALQSVQAAEPMPSLYLPAAHSEHTPPSSPVYPSLHWQSAAASLPLGDCEFGRQGVHVFAREAPAVVEYLLAAQSMHALASDAPTVPEYFPAPHCSHALSLVAPRVVEYLPALQTVHAALPVAGLYFPASHGAHGPPSGPE